MDCGGTVSSRKRHVGPQAPPARSALVHYQELQCRSPRVEHQILRAGKIAVRYLNYLDVCNPFPHPIDPKEKKKKTNLICSVYYCVELGFSIHSCFVTPEEREEILEQREEKKIEKEFEQEILKSPSMIPMTPGPMSPGHMTPGFMPQRGMLPRTPGFPPTAATGPVKDGSPVSPHMFTPRTLGFNRLGANNGSASSDLPLRNNPTQPSPQMPAHITTTEIGTSAASPMYFPPPPKKASRN